MNWWSAKQCVAKIDNRQQMSLCLCAYSDVYKQYHTGGNAVVLTIITGVIQQFYNLHSTSVDKIMKKRLEFVYVSNQIFVSANKNSFAAGPDWVIRKPNIRLEIRPNQESSLFILSNKSSCDHHRLWQQQRP